MARQLRLESRVSRSVAGFLSVMLHLGLLLFIVYSGGRQDGVYSSDTPITQVVMIESPKADRREGVKLASLEPTVPDKSIVKPIKPAAIKPPSPLVPDPEPEVAPRPADASAAELVEVPDAADVDKDSGTVADAADASDARDKTDQTSAAVATARDTDALTRAVDDPLSTFVMPQSKASALLQRIERLAEKKLATASRAQVNWKQDGSRYTAELVAQRAKEGLELDRVIAEISAEIRGRQLKTRVTLKRLAYSQFAQIIDFWDPMVQLHADEVVGRTHINSSFNVLYDSQAKPALLGKVSTAAAGFNMQSSGHTREADVFLEGIETRAGRIKLSKQVEPLAWAPHDEKAHVQKFADDTRIRFFADGSYWWRDSKSTTQHRSAPSAETVYLIAARGATLYVQGVVTGKTLIYSPQGIVIEGSLTYAHDPREAADSGDYLGLVCDKDIEVAPPSVTGPGDLDIQAAIFARRRFVVTAFEDPRHPATLRIYGSLAAGMITATEPRYATKVEFDPRFEQSRPPGFPSMNRYAAETWDRRWTEANVDTGTEVKTSTGAEAQAGTWTEMEADEPQKQ